MPREAFGPEYAFLSPDTLLTFDEITRLARVFAGLGVSKIRLTGGEPLLRRNLPDLVARLAQIPGVDDLALTTNGVLLPRYAHVLKQAGLRRVTVSLDALDPNVFARMTDSTAHVADVLRGIEAAQDVGFAPVKVNAVVQRGMNENQIAPLVRHFQNSGVTLRFIEYMDVGGVNGARWDMASVVTADEITRMIEQAVGDELVPLAPAYRGEVARRWQFASGHGEVGVIASVTHPFCSDCTRARLSAEGKLYTCLFAQSENATDLAAPLRAGASETVLSQAIHAVWQARTDRYSDERAIRRAASGSRLPMFSPHRKVEMSHIGG
jgi:cyclic pyranopterin phosphate synthase